MNQEIDLETSLRRALKREHPRADFAKRVLARAAERRRQAATRVWMAIAAMLVAGVLIAAGMRTLRWLMTQQTSAAGVFRPVGSDSFGHKRQPARAFDQQPLDAAATISACFAAWRADGDALWTTEAARAFAWFLGSNDLLSPLVDLETGSCRDGLHPDRANENRGGESVVSYLLGLTEIRRLAGMVGNRAKPALLYGASA